MFLAIKPAKKGKDAGVDGRLIFHDETAGDSKQIVLSVKGGGISSKDIRELVGTLEPDRRAPADKDAGSDLRVCVSRGELCPGGYSCRSPRRRSQEISEVIQKVEPKPLSQTE